jgi:hypothetical protein
MTPDAASDEAGQIISANEIFFCPVRWAGFKLGILLKKVFLKILC